MNRSTLILIVYQFLVVYGRDDNIFCDERFTVISDLKDVDCASGAYLVTDDKLSECVRVCKQVAKPNVDCLDDGCPPGYTCDNDGWGSLCELNKDSCFKYYTVYDNTNDKYLKAYWKPICSKEGTWEPKQCKGEKANGRCFCYDEVGKRIFGQQLSTRAENMTCACSSRRAKMEKDPNNWFVSLHCDSEGNYEPLQCNMMDEMCWCAEPKTGEVTSQIVPESMKKFLPCYNPDVNGEIYLRQCESHLFAQKKLARSLRIHGTMEANFPHVMCDADGSYGTYTVISGQAKCTWRDNSLLGSYSVPDKFDEIDCNCARDKKINPSISLACEMNGNYEKLQKLGSTYICVDSDGFQNTKDTITEESKSKCKTMI